MKYCVFSKRTWFWMIWCQAWTIFDVFVLWFNPVAHTQWWFLAVTLAMPLSCLNYLFFSRRRKGYVRLTQHGDDVRWEIV